MSYYIHDVPGRLRIKSPVLRKNKLAATAAERLMAGTNGVKSRRVNLLTGSLLINYNPTVTKHHELVTYYRTTATLTIRKPLQTTSTFMGPLRSSVNLQSM